MTIKGKNHWSWKGGVAEYPNHSYLKRKRIEKLKETSGKCEICHNDAYVVHHIDETKTNHETENLVVVCNKCHHVIHGSSRHGEVKIKDTKLNRLYGISPRDMMAKYGGSYMRFYKMHRQNRLRAFLDKNP